MAIFNGYVKLPEAIYIYQCMAFYATVAFFTSVSGHRRYAMRHALTWLGSPNQNGVARGKIIYIMNLVAMFDYQISILG